MSEAPTRTMQTGNAIVAITACSIRLLTMLTAWTTTTSPDRSLLAAMTTLFRKLQLPPTPVPHISTSHSFHRDIAVVVIAFSHVFARIRDRRIAAASVHPRLAVCRHMQLRSSLRANRSACRQLHGHFSRGAPVGRRRLRILRGSSD